VVTVNAVHIYIIIVLSIFVHLPTKVEMPHSTRALGAHTQCIFIDLLNKLSSSVLLVSTNMTCFIKALENPG
jgi:hypothetical protein